MTSSSPRPEFREWKINVRCASCSGSRASAGLLTVIVDELLHIVRSRKGGLDRVRNFENILANYVRWCLIKLLRKPVDQLNDKLDEEKKKKKKKFKKKIIKNSEGLKLFVF